MSIEVAPDPKVTANGSPGTADGSPPDGADRAEGTEGDGTAEGAEPEAGRAGTREDLAAEVSRLRAQVNESDSLREENARLSEAVNQLLGAREPEPQDEVAAFIAENWPKTVEDENGRQVRNRSHDVMAKFAELVEKRATERVRSELDPQLQGVAKTLAGDKLSRSLANEGIDHEAQRSQAFRDFVKQMERDPEHGKTFRQLRDSRPGAAADWLATKFKLRGTARENNVHERKIHEDAKNGRSAVVTSRGSATAGKQFVYDQRDPKNTERLLAFFAAGGKRENIVPKK